MSIQNTELPFRELVDAAPDGLIVTDQTTKILLANAEAERMFGYEPGELLGKRIEVLIPEAVRPRHGQHVAGFTSTPKLRPMGTGMELSGRHKEGHNVPVEISLSPIQTGQGLLITAGIRDVSERRKLEHENRRANAYLVSAVDSVHDAFALFDHDDRVLMVNSAARQLFGGTLTGSIVGVKFHELLDNSLRAGVFDLSNETREHLYSRWVGYHKNPDGTLEVRTGTGRYLRVTEIKTAEQGTVTTVADVTVDVQRAEELRRARETAEAASAAKSEFLSSMSHELRTPLNAILGFAQLLERDRKRPLDERQLERLGHVLRGGEHLLRLIDDVLDLARIEAGRISVSAEPVDVRAVVNELVAALDPMATRAGVTVEVDTYGHLPLAMADRTRLTQILMNFGSNAIKYNRQGGHVRIALKPLETRQVRVSVTDDGIGIPPDKQARIWEPFQRAGQETGPIEGTGIGLTITKRLAELMHGHVGFKSTEGVGSEFWVDLPFTGDDADAGATPVPLMSQLTKADGRKHKVIYVEDNPSNIAFMRELIEEMPSVELLTAASAELGIEMIRAHKPDVVIMDVNLPGMSGIEAVQRLREAPETAHIPVIGLSAAALLRDTARAKDAGFFRYLTKPVKVDELTGVLEEILVHGRA